MRRRIISESTRLYTPADRVWAQIGDFTNIAAWHPRVLEGRHSYEGTQKRRELDIGAESWLVERLEAHDDAAMQYQYSIVSGPFPVREAEGTVWVHADTTGSCTVNWELRLVPESEDAVTAVQDFVRAGLEKLRFGLAG
jgi:hypothetical protein